MTKFRLTAIIGILFFFGLMQSAELPVPLPKKDAIEKEMKPLAQHAIPDPLLKIIAAYADNTIRGNIALASSMVWKFQDLAVGQQYLLRKMCPEFTQNFTDDSNEHFIYQFACNFSEIGNDEFVYRADKDVVHAGISIPRQFPYRLLIGKREGDKVEFIMQGHPFELTCNQRAFNRICPPYPFKNSEATYGDELSFEEALAKLTWRGES